MTIKAVALEIDFRRMVCCHLNWNIIEITSSAPSVVASPETTVVIALRHGNLIKLETVGARMKTCQEKWTTI
jgi:hypothetical protein